MSLFRGKRPANMNVDLNNAEDQELDALMATYDDKMVGESKNFRSTTYNALMDYTYKITDKRARKLDVDIVLLFGAMAFAALDMAMTYCIGLSRRNIVAGELLKRRLKATMSEWD